VLTVLLVIETTNPFGDESAIEYPHGLPAGVVVISGLYWPPNWPATSPGPTKKIPVVGYRAAEFGFYDGRALRVNLTGRPQACFFLECMPCLSDLLLAS
jgi:hypothetical protein